MTERPEDDGAITAEERGESSVSRRTLTRTVMVLSAIVLVAGVVIGGNLLAGHDLFPAAAGDDAMPREPDPSASATPGTVDRGLTGAEDAAETEIGGRAAGILAGEDVRLSGVADLAATDPAAIDQYGTTVLAARDIPYGLADLVALGAARQDDGTTYTLVRNVVVRAGARLQIDAPGVTLRLHSAADRITSIVGWGGTVALNGAEGQPLAVTSWDEDAAAPDTDVDDGRAYVLVRNGRLESSNAHYADLGFWSGRTGGLAVTTSSGASASAALDHADTENLHYGLYLESVTDSTVTGSTIDGSTQAGIDITGGSSGVSVADTTVTGSAHNGIDVERGSQAITISGTTVTGSAGVGIRLDGSALADGPTSPGYSTALASGFTLSDVTVADNSDGGIAVAGGDDIAIDGATVTEAATAVSISGEAHTVSVTGAVVTSTRGTALAVDGDVTDALVSGSRFTAEALAVSLAGARIGLIGNTFTVTEGTVIDASGTSSVDGSGNVFVGTGPDSIATRDDAHVDLGDSDLGGWTTLPEFVLWLNHHPMAWLWLLVLVVPAVGLPLIVVRRRKHRELRRMLEDAIIQYGRRQLTDYGGETASVPDEEPVPVPATVPVVVPVDAGSRVDAALRRAAAIRAESAAQRSAPAPAGPRSSPPRQVVPPPPVRPSPSAARPPEAAEASHANGPTSLQELRRTLNGRDFVSMQQLAVAAVLETGYPAPAIARLFRVPGWRIEQWVQEALTRAEQPVQAPRRPTP